MNKLLPIIALFLISITVWAQSDRSVFYHINGSADFGRFQDRIELTPSVSVRIFAKTYLGVGLSTSYYSNETAIYTNKDKVLAESKVKDKIWYFGGELFARFIPFENKEGIIKNCFLQSSFETLRGKGKYKDTNETYNYNTTNNTVFAGVGYKQPLNEQLGLGLLLSFKLDDEKDSIYRNPVVRVSFEF